MNNVLTNIFKANTNAMHINIIYIADLNFCLQRKGTESL